MESIEAKKVINKLQQGIIKDGIIAETISAEIKNIRPIALAEELPRLVRAMRMTYEHLDAYEGFFIGMPEDVAFEEEVEGEEAEEDDTPVEIQMTDVQDDPEGQKESLDYLMSLMTDSANTGNAEEILLYINAMKEYAEDN